MKNILKRKNKKGFTLMEMLIVVGIIAILVAIAIPTFTGAQKKAQYAADVANVRAWYAEQIVTSMTDSNFTFDDKIGTDIKPKLESAGMKIQMSKAKVSATGKDATDFKVIYNPDESNKAFKPMAFGGDGKTGITSEPDED